MDSRRTQADTEKVDISERLVTLSEPNSVVSEAYRTLRTNLFYSFVDNPLKVIVVTSPGAQEGKSTTCANLGVTMAQAGKQTLILDCDLRRPTLHKIFALRNVRGLVNVLAEEARIQDSWHEVIKDLKVITPGPIPLNPTELLGAERFARFLATARQYFDYILIDSPPVGLTSDAAIIATQGDGVLLVLDERKTGKRAVRQSVHNLRTVRATILGMVMNNLKTSKDDYYHSYTSE